MSITETPGRLIAQFELFNDFVAITEEYDAVQSVRVFRRADMSEVPASPPFEIGVMEMNFAQGASNRDPSATVLQVQCSAPAQPIAVYDLDMRTGKLLLRKQSRAWRLVPSGRL